MTDDVRGVSTAADRKARDSGLPIRPTEMCMRIIINGVRIAGPTLAYWLRQAGQEVLLVEAAPQLRRGGYVIDFGLVRYDIPEKMGLVPPPPEVGDQAGEKRFLDRQGRNSRPLRRCLRV